MPKLRGGTDSSSNVYGWVDETSIEKQVVTPVEPPKPVEIVIGAVVRFKGGQHYSSSNSEVGYNVRAGQAKVTNISINAKHPYHLVHTTNESNVYGWVDAADIEGAQLATPTPAPTPKPVVTEIKKGDIVYFKGGKNYNH